MKEHAGYLKRLAALSNKEKRMAYLLEVLNWHITYQGKYARVLRLVGFPFATLQFKMSIPNERWCFQGYFKIDDQDRLVSLTTTALMEEHIKRQVYKMKRRIKDGQAHEKESGIRCVSRGSVH